MSKISEWIESAEGAGWTQVELARHVIEDVLLGYPPRAIELGRKSRVPIDPRHLYGTYDDSGTMERKIFRAGNVVESITAELLARFHPATQDKGNPGSEVLFLSIGGFITMHPWGYFPQVPDLLPAPTFRRPASNAQ